MFNGVGVPTARGTGTSGYVQTNKAFIRRANRRVRQEEFRRIEQPEKSADLKLRDIQRRIACELLELEEKLQEEGVSESIITEKLNNRRIELEVQERQQAKNEQQLKRDKCEWTNDQCKRRKWLPKAKQRNSGQCEDGEVESDTNSKDSIRHTHRNRRSYRTIRSDYGNRHNHEGDRSDSKTHTVGVRGHNGKERSRNQAQSSCSSENTSISNQDYRSQNKYKDRSRNCYRQKNGDSSGRDDIDSDKEKTELAKSDSHIKNPRAPVLQDDTSPNEGQNQYINRYDKRHQIAEEESRSHHNRQSANSTDEHHSPDRYSGEDRHSYIRNRRDDDYSTERSDNRNRHEDYRRRDRFDSRTHQDEWKLHDQSERRSRQDESRIGNHADERTCRDDYSSYHKSGGYTRRRNSNTDGRSICDISGSYDSWRHSNPRYNDRKKHCLESSSKSREKGLCTESTNNQDERASDAAKHIKRA